MPAFASLGKPLGKRQKRPTQPEPVHPKGVRLGFARSMNYAKIELEVMAAISRLSLEDQAKIPFAAGTLPEIMVALALVLLGALFRCQTASMGGRMRLGGGVIDFIVYEGSSKIIIRVQGFYWHTMPERKMKDEVQFARLKALGYRIFDAWDNDLYVAWVEGRLKEFVQDGLASAV